MRLDTVLTAMVDSYQKDAKVGRRSESERVPGVRRHGELTWGIKEVLLETRREPGARRKHLYKEKQNSTENTCQETKHGRKQNTSRNKTRPKTKYNRKQNTTENKARQ